ELWAKTALFAQSSAGPGRSPASSPSKRVADSAEHGGSLAAIAYIDITDDERPRDSAKSNTDHPVHVVKRQEVQPRGDAADIDERRHLQIETRGGDPQRADFLPQLDGRRECVAIVEASATITAQRLGAADETLAAAEGAERPERRMPRIRHVPYRGVDRENAVARDRPEYAAVDPGLAVQRVVEQALPARESAIRDPRHAARRHRDVVARVVDDRHPMQQLFAVVQAADVGKERVDGRNVGQR